MGAFYPAGRPQHQRYARGLAVDGRLCHGSVRYTAQFPAPSHHAKLVMTDAKGNGLRRAMALETAKDARRTARPVMSRTAGGVIRRACGQLSHIIERGKFGCIEARNDERRYYNKGPDYLDYVEELMCATRPGRGARRLADMPQQLFQRNYGLGGALRAPKPLRPSLRSGFLKQGHKPEDLTRAWGIEPSTLRTTPHRWNANAARGKSPDFDHVSTPKMQLQRDEAHGPYPAVRIIPEGFGAFARLATDTCARMLRGGAPIPDFYVVGALLHKSREGFIL